MENLFDTTSCCILATIIRFRSFRCREHDFHENLRICHHSLNAGTGGGCVFRKPGGPERVECGAVCDIFQPDLGLQDAGVVGAVFFKDLIELVENAPGLSFDTLRQVGCDHALRENEAMIFDSLGQNGVRFRADDAAHDDTLVWRGKGESDLPAKGGQ